jgi:bifunctional non-homologous end joining protein LigD
MNESIRLLSQKNGADKEYLVQLEEHGDGFIVTGFNGKRGGALKAQPKVISPIPYQCAKDVFDALVKSKRKDGYTLADAGAAYVIPTDVGTPTGIALHLLTQVPESDIERYIASDQYLAQEKYDGERRPAAHREDVIGSNKNGFQTALPAEVIASLSLLPKCTEIDSEHIGDTLYVFDVMKIAGECQRDLACLERKRRLDVLLNQIGNPSNLVSVETYVGTEAKRALYARLRAQRKEGIVFKRVDAAYSEGKNDAQLKIKFIESATLQVKSIHPTKRSITVQGFDNRGIATQLGSVTIPANYDIPPPDALVEVEYLYVVNSLVQPVYRGIRTDQTLESCTTSQLKYRAGIGENDDFAVLAA